MLTDSHCHLTAEQFAGDREAAIERADAAGVTRIVTIASNVRDAEATISLARAHPAVWATVGIHPHEAEQAALGDIERLGDLVGQDSVVAVGETGLDYHYDNSPRDVQRKLLDAHARLATESGLPLVIHSRSADQDLMAFLEDLPDSVTGVLHCFTGGRGLFDVAVERGWYFGYGGIATFKNFDAHNLLRMVSSDRLLLETDAPYLAPVPNRGKRNEPAYMVHVAARIAEIRGVDVGTVARTTSSNAVRLFGLPPLGSAHDEVA